MLTISRVLLDKIMAHARADHPDEACGVVAGPAGSDRPERFIAMTNAERSPTFYRFDSMEQLKVWRDMDERDEEPVVIYHSHTATEAYPSRTDVSYASEPGSHYLVVSTREPDADEVRSFRIADGIVSEEQVTVIDDAGGMIET
jgi:proteasome lid subunit RPN8/RPN11